MQRRILPEQAKAGMYVCGFGGRWLDHPFWRVRFLLEKPQDVERVRRSGVPYVVIDDELGVSEDDRTELLGETRAALHAPVRRPGRSPQPPRVLADYENARRKSDRERATALVSQSMRTMRGVFDGARLGRAVRISDVVSIVDDIAESVERSPRTLLEIVRLKRKDEYTYLHSVAVCTLMVNVARHLGKGASETRDYGLAGLLHDIGKMGIPELILNKPGGLTDTEFRQVRNHPQHGHNILSETANVPAMALDVCLHHHEKMDGTGYPFGLAADEISLAARFGAVCDVYDAVTSNRIYKRAWSPAEAIDAMWRWPGHFDRTCLFTFMQSIGVFPVGLPVELRSNRLAIVLDNHRRKSRPHVLAFYDMRERTFIEPETIVIKDDLANDNIVAPADVASWDLGDWDLLVENLTGEPPRLEQEPRAA